MRSGKPPHPAYVKWSEGVRKKYARAVPVGTMH